MKVFVIFIIIISSIIVISQINIHNEIVRRPSAAPSNTLTCNELIEATFSKYYYTGYYNKMMAKLANSSDREKYIKFPDEVEYRANGNIKLFYSGVERNQIITLKVSETNIPLSSWEQELLSENGDNFTLLDVGLIKLFQDEQTVLDIVSYAHFKHPNKNIEIVSSGKRKAAYEQLYKLRRMSHKSVLDSYELRKGEYLHEQDLYKLKAVNSVVAYPDVFTIVKNTDKRPSQLSNEEVLENIAATVQLSYRGLGDALYNFDKFRIYKDKIISSELPFTYRLKLKMGKRKQYIQALDKFFNNRKVAEITRYYKSKTIFLPKKMHALLLFRLLERGLENDVDVFLISVDPITKRLFERLYKFKLYDKLPTGTIEKEFLLYLDTSKDDFKRVYNFLKKQAGLIENHQIIPFE